MDRNAVSSAATLACIPAILAGCALPGQGMAGNLYEKTTIFSLIALTVFAIIFVSFIGNGGNSKEEARCRDLVAELPAQPLTADELTAHPVYLWDSRKSFRKLRFAPDGGLSISGIVTGNGVDPKTSPCGQWSLTPEGRVQLSFTGCRGVREYACLTTGANRLPKVLRLAPGLAEPWFFGAQALAQVQISCFGSAESAPAAGRFTSRMLSGKTVYWATYPCIMPADTEELAVNPLLAYGMIRFYEDGTLSRSINNQLGAPPDYLPSFAGSWRVDEQHGVLRISLGMHSSEVTVLLWDGKRHALLAGTTAGAEQWFFDDERAKIDLAEYLAEGAHLAPQRSGEFS